MDNNDILIRLRYALDIENKDIVEIFKLGGIELTIEKVRKLLVKPKDSYHDEVKEDEENLECSDLMLESFLNGFITFKRGKQESKPGQTDRPQLLAKEGQCMNNILLKKMKIALSLTSDDISDILESAGVSITKGELSALFRKEGHRNYRVCGDRYVRNFLKGLTIKYRK